MAAPPFNPRGNLVPPLDSPVPILANSETSNLEFAETNSVTLEWKLTGLKAIFDGSKGDQKSKCIKSAVFGDPDNLWELLFYGNSGPTSSPTSQSTSHPAAPPPSAEYSSFYLSAVPTQEEKDEAVEGRWVRRGLYAFRFEIKTINKSQTIAYKEASNHVFSSKTVNWGWQSFAKRDALYYSSPASIRSSDSFLISCTVSPTPTPPAGYWLGLGPSTSSLAFTSAASVSNPSFASPLGPGINSWTGAAGGWKGVGGGNGAMAVGEGGRRLVPSRLVESVGGLFDDPLYSDVEFLLPVRRGTSEEVVEDGVGGDFSPVRGAESSLGRVGSSASLRQLGEAGAPKTRTGKTPAVAAVAGRTGGKRKWRSIYANKKLLKRSDYFESLLEGGFSETAGLEMEDDDEGSITGSADQDSDQDAEALSSADESDSYDSYDSDDPMSMDDSHPKPVTTRLRSRRGAPTPPAPPASSSTTPSPIVGPPKMRLPVKDSAYTTWQALIYYLYTDVITFAPLTSSFIADSGGSAGVTGVEEAVRRRKEWVGQWKSERRGERIVEPCSAKAIYKLADKFNIAALKQRAFQHIISQLTVQNIPYEAFSRFSATYEQVRKVEVAFFLAHWAEIKGSPAMANIWQHIRLGRHLGFEEVWPFIVSNLEFKSSKDDQGNEVSGNRDVIA